jgi:glycosyltransferase involved in cell wall biosynthesis
MSGRIVMLLSNAFRSDPRVSKEATALVEAGFEVHVIAWNRAGDMPASEEREGFHIHRVGPVTPHGGGLANIPAYREFYADIHSAAARLEPDAVHCHDLDTAQPGLAVVKAEMPRRVALVLDMHEQYRDSNMLPQRGIKGMIGRGGARMVERRTYGRADAILVANPGSVGYYEKLGYGAKIVVVENAPDMTVFTPSDRTGEPFTIGYFGQKRYPESLLQLIEIVRDQEDVHAVLAGGGTAEEQVAEAAQGVDRIENSGSFAYSDLPRLYTKVDAVHAVYNTALGNVRSLFPVKVMEAMACGLPVIVAAGTWIGSYVEDNGLGLAVTVGDKRALADAVEYLASHPEERRRMGEAGRALVEGGLSWQSASASLISTYEGLLGS